MLRLRPYKRCDAKTIVSWIKDETALRKWSSDRFGDFPVTEEDVNHKYFDCNGDCLEADNFYPMTAFDESGVAGHLILRFTDEEQTVLRFGFVIVDDRKRGKGYGKEMLTLALRYAFDILKVNKVTLGAFENNPSAYYCYRSVGFRDVQTDEEIYYDILGEQWKCLELEILKEQWGNNMALGLKRGTVALEPHRAEWESCAEETIRVLKGVLGSDAADIQHVGSTAVRRIAAKPIIDIAVAVKEFPDMLRHEAALEEAGFIFRGENVPGDLLYVIGSPDTRTHHIHVVERNSPRWRDYLNFRDYLNADPAAAQRYSKLKEELAAAYPNDRGAYTAGKQELIGELLREAAAWREEQLCRLEKYRQ